MSKWCGTCYRNEITGDWKSCDSGCPIFGKNHDELAKYVIKMIDHMKKTSLYDVYLYEEMFATKSIEPMEILIFDNNKLKKEVNQLREQLGMGKKYRD